MARSVEPVPLVETAEAESRGRESRLALDGFLVGADRRRDLPLRLLEKAQVVRREEVFLVEVHRLLVLLARVPREPAGREQVAEVVAQRGVARIRLDPLLLGPDPLVQRVARHEVGPVEGRLRPRRRRRRRARGAATARAVCLFTASPPGLRRATSRTRPSRILHVELEIVAAHLLPDLLALPIEILGELLEVVPADVVPESLLGRHVAVEQLVVRGKALGCYGGNRRCVGGRSAGRPPRRGGPSRSAAMPDP